MPLLGEEDPFRSIVSDTYDIPDRLFVSTETQLRPNYKNQRIVQKSRPKEKLNDKETVNDEEEIQATISADVADGHNAQLDASLKLLSEDDPKLILPNDLEDDEIHIIEAAATGPSGANVPSGGNHALQKYQMELMLLEQQNKKRLLMARQEQERPSTPFDEVAAARELKRRYRTDVMMRKDQAEAGQKQQPFLAFEPPALHIPTAKRQKRGTARSWNKGNIDLVNGSGSAAVIPVSHHCVRDGSSRHVHMLIVTSTYATITTFSMQSHALKVATRASMEG